MTTEYLVHQEMEHVLAALTPPNRLVCRVCVATGLRVGDVVTLKTDQIARQFWITEAKTGKRRRVNLTDNLLLLLRAQAGPIYVFQGRAGVNSHRTRQAVWRDVKRASKAFRLPQNVGVHSLRKVWAVDKLMRSKGDLSQVQRALNHSDASTTMIYAMSYQLYQAKYGQSNRADG